MDSATATYRTKNFLWVFGDDFSFYYADQNYKFMDDIIAIVNSNTDKFIFKYSTAMEYYQAVKAEKQAKSIDFPVHVADFFPMV